MEQFNNQTVLTDPEINQPQKELPKVQTQKSSISFFVICLVIGFVLPLKPVQDFLAIITGGAWKLSPQISVFTLFLIFPMQHLAIIIHEFGHLAFGWFSGFKPSGLILFPFAWLRGKKGWMYHQIPNAPFGGGMAMMYPVGFTRLRERLFWFTIGAGLTNILSGLLSLYLGAVFASGFQGKPSSFGHPAFYFAIFGLISIWIGIGALIPRTYQSRGFKGLMSDGKRAQRLLQNKEIESELGLIQIEGLIYQEQRPREWSNALVQKITSETISSFIDVSGLYCSYQSALDNNDIPKAKILLERVLENIHLTSEFTQSEFRYEAAFFAARYEKNAITARTWFEQGELTLRLADNTRLRAETALHIIENRPAQAYATAQEALALMEERIDQGLVRFERDLFKLMTLEVEHAAQMPLEPYQPIEKLERKIFTYMGAIWIVLALFLLFQMSETIAFLKPKTAIPTDMGLRRALKVAGIPFGSLIALVLALPFASIITRVGYLIAGISARLRFGTFHISGFSRIVRHNKKLKFATSAISALLGETGLLAPNTNQSIKRQLQKTLWGGWGILVVLGTIGLALNEFAERNFWDQKVAMQILQIWGVEGRTLLQIWGITTLLIPLIPYGFLLIAFGWLFSFLRLNVFDGAWRLALMYKNGKETEREAARVAIIGAATNGIRPRDWSEDWLKSVTQGDPICPRDVHMLICAYFAALDHNQINQAREYLERASAAAHFLPFPFNRALLLEQVFYTAWYAEDAQAARKILQHESGYRIDTTSFHRVLAALYFVENKLDQAKVAIQTARANIAKSQHPGIAIFEKDCLDQLEIAMLEKKSNLEIQASQNNLEV